MTRSSDVNSHLRDVFHGIDHTLRILGCRGHHEGCLVVHGVGHGIQVRGPVNGHIHHPGPQPEQVCRFVEGGVSARREDNLWFVDTPLDEGPFAGSFNSAQDALGSAAGHEASGAFGAVEQVSCPGAKFGLDGT